VRARHLPELGPRGEGWVVLQSLLFLAIAGCSFAGITWPGSVESFFVVLGLVMAAAGAVLLVLGALALGRSFTPFPRPHERAEFRQGGVYRLVRHPIYGGVLALALGWSLAEAPLALVPTALLVVVFDLKARREEAWLVERYPAYAAYRTRTPRRLVPFVY
jgi:protein-S-isoprenylcysteine O-methyltransferase Ste14